MADVRTYPLGERWSKVTPEKLAKPLRVGASFQDFANSLPRILAGKDIKDVAVAVAEAEKSATEAKAKAEAEYPVSGKLE